MVILYSRISTLLNRTEDDIELQEQVELEVTHDEEERTEVSLLAEELVLSLVLGREHFDVDCFSELFCMFEI